eukprot:TRINITY_DN11101_c0_g1_i1.p1 TRINITY_DN11101_c0_g1~~TRINITY_DN11101_c0_g1_i1.p1  ORF type:complete len:773 (+),score=226.13 TRINITY_DN11101_c0_g1_i1:55-2373(+)
MSTSSIRSCSDAPPPVLLSPANRLRTVALPGCSARSSSAGGSTHHTARSVRSAATSPGGRGRAGAEYSVRVYLRIRPFTSPLSPAERAAEPGVCALTTRNCTAVQLKSDRTAEQHCFDHVFDHGSRRLEPGCDARAVRREEQEEVFARIGPELLDGIEGGYNVTLLAYGQTASGKTYTMTGGDHKSGCRGVIPRLIDELFERMSARQKADAGSTFRLEAGYLELYNEQLRDLCAPAGPARRLQIREHPQRGPYAEGLTTTAVVRPSSIRKVLDVGSRSRSTRTTKMNDASSRSHAVLQLTLTQFTMEAAGDGSPRTAAVVSKVNLVDLAGSERQKQSGVEGDALREMIHINTALHCLRKVIELLTDGKRQKGSVLRAVQRESALTWLLSDALGGNARTALIATVSPSAAHMVETLSTLRYASKARAIENCVRVNSEESAVVLACEAETQRLQEQLLRAKEKEPSLTRTESTFACRSDASEAERVDALERRHEHIRGVLSGSEDRRHRLAAQLADSKQKLRQLREAEARAIRYQRDLAEELSDATTTIDSQKRLIGDLEARFTARLQELARGDPAWQRELHRSCGRWSPSTGAAENALLRVGTQSLQEIVVLQRGALADAYQENASLVQELSSTQSLLSTSKRRVLLHDEHTATVRKLQDELANAHRKEEKYLKQINHLMLEFERLRRQNTELREELGDYDGAETVDPPTLSPARHHSAASVFSQQTASACGSAAEQRMRSKAFAFIASGGGLSMRSSGMECRGDPARRSLTP